MKTLSLLTIYRLANLICHLSNVIKTKWQKAVFFNKVIGTKSQKLKHNANMTMMFKRFQHLDTAALKKKKKAAHMCSHTTYIGSFCKSLTLIPCLYLQRAV